jgi:hypothetical protein
MIDLFAVDTSLSIAPNFTLNEFAQDWKGQWAVVRPEMVAKWQAIRSSLGVPIYINSGFRSPGYNSGLSGAATYSRHMYGDAGDVQANGAVSLQAIADECAVRNAYFIKLYTGHVHCDWRDIPLGTDFWPAAAKPGSSAFFDEPPVWADVPEPENAQWRLGENIRLTARWTGFDEGIPWVQWVVYPPGASLGTVFENQAYLDVPLERIGRWRITWIVGGVVTGSIEHEVTGNVQRN